MKILTEIRQCLRRWHRKFSVGSPLVIEGVRALPHTCFQKVCIFYGALGLGVYGCICARSEPQDVACTWDAGLHMHVCWGGGGRGRWLGVGAQTVRHSDCVTAFRIVCTCLQVSLQLKRERECVCVCVISASELLLVKRKWDHGNPLSDPCAST